MPNTNLQSVTNAGTSIWLDDLSRDRINTGNLEELIRESCVTGVTTNPSIFAAAMTKGTAYDDQIAQLAATGTPVDEAVFTMATQDVQNACDLFADVAQATNGVDGRVSIEVDPRYANDTEATITQARELVRDLNRENYLIKIPATKEGLPAITAAISEGISVNVTLIFSVERYREVVEAYLSGLEAAQSNGHDLSTIVSVASFFVSRVDTEIDKRLDEIGSDEAVALKGKAGVANARLAYAAYRELFSGDRWDALASAGANVQRPLWASTSVKNPDYPSTMYVYELTAPNTVNTMPEGTLDAVAAADSSVSGATITEDAEQDAAQVFANLESIGIDLDDVFTFLEDDGVKKFVASWNDLLDAIRPKLETK